MQRPKAMLLGLALCVFTPSLHAQYLGVRGHVFPIGEIDMLSWIDQRLRHLKQTGEMEAMKNRMQEQVKARVLRPKPVAGLTTTTTPKTYYIDPTLTLAKEIKDSRGNVLYPKGTSINPFDSQTWPAAERLAMPQFAFSKQLVFLDSDDPRQRNWAQHYTQPLPTKWILTNGEPAKLSKQLNQPVYFDQHGNLTRHFKIKHIPVVIRQQGTRWQVTEIDVSETQEE